ncbi:stress responsive A/B barrel domain-containing protein [Xylariaceae sp. FL0804]|nr:stress responsive A/B barrel domain-containing protein [Xylariaceae sp. FL0804]
MTNRIHRTTLFKILGSENQQKLIQAYTNLGAKQQKDGKPYILSMKTGLAMEDMRSQGFTVASQAEFASLDDMKYYDTEDPAHNELKAHVKELGVEGGPKEGVLVVYFTAGATL